MSWTEDQYNQYVRRNNRNTNDTRMPNKPKQLDRDKMGKDERDTPLETHFKLAHVGVVFFAKHGKRFDEDNRRYIVKPLLDAIVSLKLASSDKDITSDVTQRMDENNTYI